MSATVTFGLRQWQVSLLAAGILLLPELPAGQAASRIEPGSAQVAALATAPLYFEANQGQADDTARFIARGRQCDILLAPAEATLVLNRRETITTDWPRERPIRWNQITATRTVRLVLEGANPQGRMTGLGPRSGRVNYLLGDNPADWHKGVPLFTGVQIEAVYPGINLVYYADPSARLEYDFVLQPNARADRISFRIEGADKVSVNRAGELVLKIGADELRQHRPILYQQVAGRRQPVRGGYRLTGKNTVGFAVGNYDRHLPLVIDPVILDMATYLGGSKAEDGWSIAVDGTGIYVTGETLSKDLHTTPGAFANKYSGGIASFGDAFVAKYDLSGTNLIYLTYLGGKRNDGAFGIAVQGGIAYLTGFTDSQNFPIVPTNNPANFPLSGPNNNAFRLFPVNAFVAALDPTGSSLVFSTLIGGILRDAGEGIAVDPTGVYISGMTESTNFPVFPTNAPTAFQTNFGGNTDAFVTKLDLTGTSLIYSTYLGGKLPDFGEGLAVDSGGNAWVTGFTSSTNFPLTNAIVLNGITYTNLNTKPISSKNPETDAFVSKLSSDGTTLLFSSYLGGTNADVGLHIAVDSSDNAYVTGHTASKNFPTNTIPLPQSTGTNKFTTHVFVTRLDSSGNVIYSTQFGSSKKDQGRAIAADNSGQAYVTGFTSGTNFFARLPTFEIVTNCTQVTNCTVTTNLFLKTYADFRASPFNASGKKIKVTSENNVFIAILSADGTAFVGTNSVLIGGAGSDEGNGIVVDPAGTAVYFVGQTTSPNFPVTTNAPQKRLGNVKNSKAADAFVGKILLLP
jgi:Beta-propeller repeat